MSVFLKYMLVVCVCVLSGCEGGSKTTPISKESAAQQLVVNTCDHDYVAYRDGDGEWIDLTAAGENKEHVLNVEGKTYSVAIINDYSLFIDATVVNFNRNDEFRFDVCGAAPGRGKVILPAGWQNLGVSIAGQNGLYDVLAKAYDIANSERYYMLHRDMSLKDAQEQVFNFNDLSQSFKLEEGFDSGITVLKQRFPELDHYSISYSSKNGVFISLPQDESGIVANIPSTVRHEGDLFSHGWYFRDEVNQEQYRYNLVSDSHVEDLPLNNRPKSPPPTLRLVENGRTMVHLSPYYLDTLQKDAEFYSVESEKVYGSEDRWQTIYWRVVASKEYLFSSGRPPGKITIPEPDDFPNLQLDLRSVSAEAEFGGNILGVSYDAYSPSIENWAANEIGSANSSISVQTD